MVTTSVICRSPPLNAGHTSVEITHGHGGRSLRSVEFHYEVHPEIYTITPLIAPVDGSSIISILGEHLIGNGQLCSFGAALSRHRTPDIIGIDPLRDTAAFSRCSQCGGECE